MRQASSGDEAFTGSTLTSSNRWSLGELRTVKIPHPHLTKSLTYHVNHFRRCPQVKLDEQYNSSRTDSRARGQGRTPETSPVNLRAPYKVINCSPTPLLRLTGLKYEKTDESSGRGCNLSEWQPNSKNVGRVVESGSPECKGGIMK